MKIKKCLVLLTTIAMLATPLSALAQEPAAAGEVTEETVETETVIDEVAPDEELPPSEEETEDDSAADEDVNEDDSAVDGDVNEDDSTVDGDVNEDGSAVDGDTNGDGSTVDGDVNEDGSTVDEDVNGDDPAVDGSVTDISSSELDGAEIEGITEELIDFELTEDKIIAEEETAESMGDLSYISLEGALLLELTEDGEKFLGYGSDQTVACVSSEVAQLNPPSIQWTNPRIGAYAYGKASGAIAYQVLLVKEGKAIVGTTIGASVADGTGDFRTKIMESGTYQVAVAAITSGESFEDPGLYYRLSSKFVFNRPSSSLSTPSGLAWKGKNATWAGVGNVDGYEVTLYADGEWLIRRTLTGNYADALKTDFSKYLDDPDLAGVNAWTFSVKALSGDLTKTLNSEDSSPSEAYVAPDPSKTKAFVDRMYRTALGRAAEDKGLNDWTDRLISGEIDGAALAQGVIMSEEFTNRNLSDSAYLDVLYKAFFDRAADKGGKDNWTGKLSNGISREYVLAGFVNSTEFANLCKEYGISPGHLTLGNYRDQNEGVTMFVNRLYEKAFGRKGEPDGMEDWTGRILRKEMSPETVAKQFFFSEEFANRKLDNTEFVKVLYRTFMGREFDEAGLKDWVGKLEKGTSREKVLEGFSRSTEFSNIMKQYGL